MHFNFYFLFFLHRTRVVENSWKAVKLYSGLFLVSFFPAINSLTVKAFFPSTSFRKSMKEHSEVSHDSSRQLPAAARQGDLSCPFCLYQTKNKNYMIDHIVLHRGQSATLTEFRSRCPTRTASPFIFFCLLVSEERVVPIEPCRPQLSRYLQGIVLRCHKCTFTSGSAESLRLHMTKHDDVKPYKCRLCFFDCTQLSDLEAHLSDKHQVRIYCWHGLSMPGILVSLSRVWM